MCTENISTFGVLNLTKAIPEWPEIECRRLNACEEYFTSSLMDIHARRVMIHEILIVLVRICHDVRANLLFRGPRE